MQLGNENEALDALKKAVTLNSNPEILGQAWYQLAIVYRRMHRLEEAQQAMSTFQKLKEQESEHRQQELEKKLPKHNPQSPAPQGNISNHSSLDISRPPLRTG